MKMVYTLWSYYSTSKDKDEKSPLEILKDRGSSKYDEIKRKDNERPKIIDYCISTWKKHLKGWEIRVLTPSTLSSYWEPPEGFYELNEQIQLDLIRLGILYDYGGVWLDPNVVLRQDLSWLLNQLNTVKHFTGFRKNWNKYMEDWCLAVVKPRDPIIRKWYLQLYEASRNPDHPAFSIEPVTNDPKTFLSHQVFYYLTITDHFFAEDVNKLLPSSLESVTGSHRLHKYTDNSLEMYSNIYIIILGIFLIILILVVIYFTYTMFIKKRGFYTYLLENYKIKNCVKNKY